MNLFVSGLARRVDKLMANEPPADSGGAKPPVAYRHRDVRLAASIRAQQAGEVRFV